MCVIGTGYTARDIGMLAGSLACRQIGVTEQ